VAPLGPTVQRAFGPQGEGLHGSDLTGSPAKNKSQILVAELVQNFWLLITVNRDDVAGPEGVSSGSVWATAHRDVVGDSTNGLETASAGTRVLALVADARSVHCAI
jgi:hypothetical protein